MAGYYITGLAFKKKNQCTNVITAADNLIIHE